MRWLIDSDVLIETGFWLPSLSGSGPKLPPETQLISMGWAVLAKTH